MMLNRLQINRCLIDESGSVLVITLMLVAVLVGLTTEFAYEVFVDSSAFSNWSNAQKASLLARSGQNLGARFINENKKDQYNSEGKTVLPLPASIAGGDELSVTIEDETARFNVNSIIYPNGLTNEKALASLQKLLEYLNINPELAYILADWIDPDAEPRLSGAEDGAGNRFLWSIEELTAVRDIDTESLKILRPHVTVFGNGLVNINTAGKEVLQCLSSDMTGELAERIIDYRKAEPFRNKNQIVRVDGLEAVGIGILDRITVKSLLYRVTAKASVNNIPRVIESVTDDSRVVHYWREG